jgi:hypothetical protein
MFFYNKIYFFIQTTNKYISFYRLHPPPIHLGRWSIDKCQNKINKTIDYSNTDHCGSCGIIPITNKNENEKDSI